MVQLFLLTYLPYYQNFKDLCKKNYWRDSCISEDKPNAEFESDKFSIILNSFPQRPKNLWTQQPFDINFKNKFICIPRKRINRERMCTPVPLIYIKWQKKPVVLVCAVCSIYKYLFLKKRMSFLGKNSN